MKKVERKYEYICQSCGKPYLSYPSHRRGKTHACSKECSGKLRSSKQKGENNPNYKHGAHCTESLCDCGSKKDYRADKCSKCTQLHKPKEGYTRDLDGIVKAVRDSESYIEAAMLCGEYRKKIKKVVEELGLDVSHFCICAKRPTQVEDIFKIHDKRENGKVRKYLIRHEIIDYKCSSCGLEDYWNGENLTLQLDHINGNSCDNRLENLRFLCPNCHTQTSTFCGRNINAKP